TTPATHRTQWKRDCAIEIEIGCLNSTFRSFIQILKQKKKKKKKKKKNGVEISEQEGMAHREPSEHRERVEGRAKARGRAE
ncbi:MAG: hypothetical protein J8272_00720, partial ['Prunus persica' phytoplasma PP2]|nr:hypothetical protein ['Prunus persica' phytoplasma PP2]